MRRLFTTLSLVLFSLAFWAANERVVAQYRSTDRVFMETSYDFKGIPRYTTPRHPFVFVNNAKEDLQLVAVRTTCQCVQAFVPEKRVFKTGEKGEVAVQIDAVRFTGARHATVTVTFERAGRFFEVPLDVVGTILENVRVEPNQLNLVVNELSKEELGEDPQTLRPNRSQYATVFYPGAETVVRAECANPSISVQIGRAVRFGGGTQTPIAVSIRNDAPAGYISTVVRLWSNGAFSQVPLSLNVSGSVRPQLSVSPSTLTFFTSKGEKIVKNVVISATNEFMLKKIECESKAIECNIPQRSLRPAKICVIPISFDPSKLQNESGMTRIKFETVDGRVLYLPTYISSGNFDELGMIQTDRDIEIPEFDGNEELKIVVSDVQEVVPTDELATADSEGEAIQESETVSDVLSNQNDAYPQSAPSRSYQQSRPRAQFTSPFNPFGLFQWPQR